MADEMGFDFSELTRLAADLGHVADDAVPFIKTALRRTAGNVKDAANKSVTEDGGNWKGLADAIDYDAVDLPGVLGQEIGYNKARYGDRAKLGNLREFGAPNAPSGFFSGGKFIPIPGTRAPRAPHNDLLNALQENVKDFEHGLSEALKDAERAAGL